MKLFRKLEAKSKQLVVNVMWLLGTEVTARATRLLTIIAMAFYLSPTEYGIVMLTLAANDVVRLVLRCGAGAQIVQCAEEELTRYCRNGMSVQWIVCSSLTLIQIAVSQVFGMFYDSPEVQELLFAMSFVYLLYPLTSVQVYLVQREAKLDYFSIRNGSCLLVENLSIPIFLWLGAGLWSIVLSKFLFGILWTILFINAPVKRYSPVFEPQFIVQMLKNSGRLVSTELSRALRLHSDVFIAAKLIQPEMFGLYAFAKSAGIGVSQAISNAFNAALFPYLCQSYRDGVSSKAVRNSLFLMVGVACLFLIQGFAAPIYVPIIFGEKWLLAADVITILCTAAICLLMLDTSCNIQRAKGQFQAELNTRFVFSSLAVATFLLWQPDSLEQCAYAVLAGSAIWPAYFVICKLTQLNTTKSRNVVSEEERSCVTKAQ